MKETNELTNERTNEQRNRRTDGRTSDQACQTDIKNEWIGFSLGTPFPQPPLTLYTMSCRGGEVVVERGCIYLNLVRRTCGWCDEWDDTALRTQDSKFEPWWSFPKHGTCTSRSGMLSTILNLYEWARKTYLVSLKPGCRSELGTKPTISDCPSRQLLVQEHV